MENKERDFETLDNKIFVYCDNFVQKINRHAKCKNIAKHKVFKNKEDTYPHVLCTMCVRNYSNRERETLKFTYDEYELYKNNRNICIEYINGNCDLNNCREHIDPPKYTEKSF